MFGSLVVCLIVFLGWVTYLCLCFMFGVDVVWLIFGVVGVIWLFSCV